MKKKPKKKGAGSPTPSPPKAAAVKSGGPPRKPVASSANDVVPSSLPVSKRPAAQSPPPEPKPTLQKKVALNKARRQNLLLKPSRKQQDAIDANQKPDKLPQPKTPPVSVKARVAGGKPPGMGARSKASAILLQPLPRAQLTVQAAQARHKAAPSTGAEA